MSKTLKQTDLMGVPDDVKRPGVETLRDVRRVEKRAQRSEEKLTLVVNHGGIRAFLTVKHSTKT